MPNRRASDYCNIALCTKWVQKKGLCTVHLREQFPELWRERRILTDTAYRQKRLANPEYREKRRLDKNRTATAMAMGWRDAVLMHYSEGRMRCSCPGCDTTRKEFLSIDHMNGRTEKDNFTGYKFYRWLMVNNYPKGYRVLCHNCNQAYGYYGYCPHNR